ncbi:hypothetical protein Vadar_025839 [Vaccinium darrowii]|uniref:Uncharacterized protein n=1 Tax=Vaccinium darrowii TaxID=229202 RepID=A0ACB7ZES3_9ERIC|nr:hypothetical protein Vadar_025839 [Vaccinium darrowii]
MGAQSEIRIELKEVEIVAGDHIYTWRSVFAYSHHGIYVGGGKVVHFMREPNSGSSGVSFLRFFGPTSDPFLGVICFLKYRGAINLFKFS